MFPVTDALASVIVGGIFVRLSSSDSCSDFTPEMEMAPEVGGSRVGLNPNAVNQLEEDASSPISDHQLSEWFALIPSTFAEMSK